MSVRPIKTWSYPGNLLDALVDTRKVVAGVELPLPTPSVDEARDTMRRMLDQLDHHLIPRVREEASPAVVVVAGSTGAGKSTVVNALVGEQLTPSGVLRPTTRIPHVFHHPLDTSVLTEVEQRGKVIATEAVPRGLAIVDSPDLDSVRGENREIAKVLLEAADLWIFVTTPARYGDALPWEALRAGADRGASIAVVLNRVTVDIAAQVRRELVDRLTLEHLETLPLFVIPEDTARQATVPRDVVNGLGRWLDSVAAASAATIVERTLHGAAESVKEWLEVVAEAMDEQSAAAKDVRSEVRRSAAQVENEGGDRWWETIPTGALTTRWQQATADGGALFRLRNSLWVKRRHLREDRDTVLHEIYVDVLDAVESRLVHAAASVAEAMTAALRRADTGVGPWLAERRDPRDARQARERQAADAARRWMHRCQEIVLALPGASSGIEVVGEPGLTTTLASAALGIEEARTALMVLTGQAVGEAVEEARAELAAARRHCVSRESLDMMRPTDIPSLMPDSSAKIRLRRAELRGLL
ncbi:dynamin family protein [Demequina sp. SYSU T00039]|uniref:Dynamin family protein n=1 Tax=Demequina lignilytica TaxID=3051663 RepID=A0AAW7M886_9MICO|nr:MULTISPECIES: dynamin family protein [unclassified Demequina]MDN4479277.1 dynamin family protein [Demequina sp. SYSU T00039-1]MDN4487595.1 dynamin family protein [Demequina sp. SYSU T00039]MDN4490935.1 dynamin family protein [Demequina sp. SYSU T00068]